MRCPPPFLLPGIASNSQGSKCNRPCSQGAEQIHRKHGKRRCSRKYGRTNHHIHRYFGTARHIRNQKHRQSSFSAILNLRGRHYGGNRTPEPGKQRNHCLSGKTEHPKCRVKHTRNTLHVSAFLQGEKARKQNSYHRKKRKHARNTRADPSVNCVSRFHLLPFPPKMQKGSRYTTPLPHSAIP